MSNIFENSIFNEKDHWVDYELDCKIEICKILNFVMDKRLDFLITNTIEWWKDNKLRMSNEVDVTEILPPIMENGIKYQVK